MITWMKPVTFRDINQDNYILLKKKLMGKKSLSQWLNERIMEELKKKC